METILEWSNDRPGWQRDALRRIVQKGHLDENDIGELVALCKEGRCGGSGYAGNVQPLKKSHLPANPGASASVSLIAIKVHDPVYLRKQGGSGKVDYFGIVLIGLALGLFQIVLTRGGRAGWFVAPWVRYLSAASALSMLLLVVHELRFPEPILDLRILKIFGFTLSVILLSLLAGAVQHQPAESTLYGNSSGL